MTSHHPISHTKQKHPHRSFWDGVKSKTKAGWEKILPNNPPEMGQEGLADTLEGMVNFLPVKMRWMDREITVSLENGDTTGDLISGGIMPTGTIKLYFSKSKLSDNQYPEPNETVELLQMKKWQSFSIISVSEPFDQADPAIVLTVELDNV